MDLRRLGLMAYADTMNGGDLGPFARKVESLGYGILWIPETFGRDPFPLAAHLLSATTRIVVGTAIANVWKREAITTAAAARTLAELYPDRFILGLGVSGGPFMLRNGLRYDKPVTYMREYLARIKTAPHKAPRPAIDPPVVVAGLLPRMLRLAAEQTNGTITALTPPDQIARIRREVGPDTWILAQQVVILEPDAKKARAAARGFMHFYLGAPMYQRTLHAMGFTDADFANDGSDRLIDAMITWGDAARIRAQLEAHWQAGATHVFITPLSTAGGNSPDLRAIEALAPTAN
jgi:probable F420-dependent oxidoreductase